MKYYLMEKCDQNYKLLSEMDEIARAVRLYNEKTIKKPGSNLVIMKEVSWKVTEDEKQF